MATDQSPPRLKAIVTVAIIAPLTLIVLKFVLDSYFIMLSEEATHAKLAQPVELEKLREGEQKNLTSSPTPITAAMMEIGKGRTEQGGPDLISPQPSDDIGPLTGWTKLPRQFEVPPTAPPPPPALLGDGGAATAATDGGAAPPRPNDAGAPRRHLP
jgi:hypothetical protein